MNLRNYQVECLNQLKVFHKNLVHLSTGAGKSVIFKEFIRERLKNNQKVLFLVYGNSILEQAVKKHFSSISNNVSYNDFKGEIMCYSIATLVRRKKDWPSIFSKIDCIVIDEAHNCTSNSYKKILEQVDEYKIPWILGLTATPYKIGKKTHDYWDNVIHPISVKELIQKGFLVFPKCFVAEIKMNTNVKTQNGDFKNNELFQKNDDMVIYGSIVNEYKKHGMGKKAVCFAVNVEHSKKIAQEFNDQGIKAVHADANTPMETRSKILHDFEHGDIQILCNVNIFSTGIDIPIAEIGIMARPTKSLVLWIQQVGRLLRTHPNKKFATILDHGGNIERLGHPLTDFMAQTDPNNLDSDSVIDTYVCKKCFYVYSSSTSGCPICGAANEKKEQEEKEKAIIEAELKEYEIKKQLEKANKYKQWKERYVIHNENLDEYKKLLKLIERAETFDLKPNWVFYEMKKLYPETCELVLEYPFWFNK